MTAIVPFSDVARCPNRVQGAPSPTGHEKFMTPSPAQRDELFKRFARALFKGDMDALYAVVAPGFRWSFHDGLAVTKSSSVLRPFANTSPHKRSCSRRSDFTTRPIVTPAI